MIQHPENATDVINTLATQFRVPVTYLWSALIRQAYVYAGQWSIMAIVAAIGARVWTRYAKKEFARPYTDSYDDKLGAWLGSIAVGIVCLIILGFTLDAIGDAINPAGYAVTQILSAIK